MAVEMKKKVLDALKHADFAKHRPYISDKAGAETSVSYELSNVCDEALRELLEIASEMKERTLLRSVKILIAARAGDFSASVPNLGSAEAAVKAYLSKDAIDGWIYVRNDAGFLSPELVTSISIMSLPRDDKMFLSIKTMAISNNDDNSRNKKVSPCQRSHRFDASDVVNKSVVDFLDNASIYKETPELKAEYTDAIDRHIETIMPSFSEQFRFTGVAVKYDSWAKRGASVERRKVINDLEMSDYASINAFEATPLLPEAADGSNAAVNGVIPLHPVMRVFDLKSYDFYWVDSRSVSEYVYDKELGEKLVLPPTHRGLLDVLTNDLSSFTGDIVEGKGTGNVILCTGRPGLGKTLTAEAYAEKLRRPLYAIHSGNLGTTAAEVEKKLAEIFVRAARWNAILLLDESDVFVMERGSSLEVNAVVAVFLRSMEYFNGLLFMTTNRHENIDDAILSRCLAIIRFKHPDADGTRAIWTMMSRELGIELSAGLVDELVATFSEIAGRDIKQLCGTVFRMVSKGAWNLDADSFRRAAMFRGVDMVGKLGRTAVEGVDDEDIARSILLAQQTLEAELGFRPSPADALKYIMKKAAGAAQETP